MCAQVFPPSTPADLGTWDRDSVPRLLPGTQSLRPHTKPRHAACVAVLPQALHRKEHVRKGVAWSELTDSRQVSWRKQVLQSGELLVVASASPPVMVAPTAPQSATEVHTVPLVASTTLYLVSSTAGCSAQAAVKCAPHWKLPRPSLLCLGMLTAAHGLLQHTVFARSMLVPLYA